ncbi:MAG: methionyl-tRNA formyltransferase [Spirochaetales bacterium]
MSLRILFAGTPEIALPSLECLMKEFSVVGVLTAPDQQAGRGRNLYPSPVKTLALQLGLPVYTPEKLDACARQWVQEHSPDVLVVVAYGKILGPKFLGLFPKGAINLHPSLLPKYRGPSPIPAAILAGDTETGITIQRISLKMDAGPILLQEKIPLNGTETTESLTRLCAEKGAPMLVTALRNLAAGKGEEIPQDESKATYCKLITKEDGKISWYSTATYIERMIRAYTPWPTAWTLYSGAVLKILKGSVVEEGFKKNADTVGKVIGVDKTKGILVQTGSGVLALERLQLQGRKVLQYEDFLRGMRNFVGAILGA